MIGALVDELPEDDERLVTVLQTLPLWIAALDGWYGGAEVIAPLYGLYFDVLWAKGEHPYLRGDGRSGRVAARPDSGRRARGAHRWRALTTAMS